MDWIKQNKNTIFVLLIVLIMGVWIGKNNFLSDTDRLALEVKCKELANEYAGEKNRETIDDGPIYVSEYEVLSSTYNDKLNSCIALFHAIHLVNSGIDSEEQYIIELPSGKLLDSLTFVDNSPALGDDGFEIEYWMEHSPLFFELKEELFSL